MEQSEVGLAIVELAFKTVKQDSAERREVSMGSAVQGKETVARSPPRVKIPTTTQLRAMLH